MNEEILKSMLLVFASLPPETFIPILVVVVLTVFALGFFTAKLYTHNRQDLLIGHDAEIIDWKPRTKRVIVFGEIWKADCHTHHDFKKGETVVIIGKDNLCLHITKKDT